MTKNKKDLRDEKRTGEEMRDTIKSKQPNLKKDRSENLSKSTSRNISRSEDESRDDINRRSL